MNNIRINKASANPAGTFQQESKEPVKLTGARILVQSLIEQGVDVVFGYPGGAILNVYDALYDSSIRHVITSHEQGASHAADGYARSTGKPGVVLATSGPGATNLVTGIATAYHDSVPLVAVTCNVTRDLIGRDSFQEVDIVDITNPIVKHNYMIQDVNEIAHVVKEAFEIASSGRKGPVLIDIPKDITAAEALYLPEGRYQLRETPRPDKDSLLKAAEVIEGSEAPLIFCGGGVTFSDSGELLAKLADRLQAPVCVSMMGLSAIPPDNQYYLGLVGMHGTAAANQAVLDCDVLITVGARFSDRVTGDRELFSKNKRVVHIDIDPSEISKNIHTDYPVVGEAARCISELLSILPRQKRPDWMHRVLKNKALNSLPVVSADGSLTAKEIISTLSRLTENNSIVATDVGQHQMFVAQYYSFFKPRTFISSCGLGTMGYGMGAANGAAVGNPGTQVILVTGDGSFHMNMTELAVAVSNRLPIVILVMNNRVLGMVHQWQKLFYNERYSQTELGRKTDYVKTAEGFGAAGLRIVNREQLEPVLKDALAMKGPVVVDCRIEASERVFPIIPPGKTGRDMIYFD